MARLQEWRWKFIEESIVDFNCGLHDTTSIATQRLSRFRSWYYHPGLDLIGPCRFIAHWSNHQNYDGWTSGNEPNNLSTYFEPVRDEKEYDLCFGKLEELAKRHNLKLNSWNRFSKPKHEVIEKFMSGLLKIDEDIVSMETEWMTTDEGEQKKMLVNKFERNPKIRKQAIIIHGTQCMACQFDFEKRYGEHGKRFIEVHHIVPLSLIKDKHSVNPKTDTVVLCANCHRMVHRDHNNPLTLEQLMAILREVEGP